MDQILGTYLKQIGRDPPMKPLERSAPNRYGASVADAVIAKNAHPGKPHDSLEQGHYFRQGAEANMQRLTDIDTARPKP